MILLEPPAEKIGSNIERSELRPHGCQLSRCSPYLSARIDIKHVCIQRIMLKCLYIIYHLYTVWYMKMIKNALSRRVQPLKQRNSACGRHIWRLGWRAIASWQPWCDGLFYRLCRGVKLEHQELRFKMIDRWDSIRYMIYHNLMIQEWNIEVIYIYHLSLNICMDPQIWIPHRLLQFKMARIVVASSLCLVALSQSSGATLCALCRAQFFHGVWIKDHQSW